MLRSKRKSWLALISHKHLSLPQCVQGINSSVDHTHRILTLKATQLKKRFLRYDCMNELNIT